MPPAAMVDEGSASAASGELLMLASDDKNNIVANMRRWQKHGMNPHDPKHMNAYVLARQGKERVRPADLLQIMQPSAPSHESSVRLSSEFPLVPMSNFASMLPPQVLQSIVPEAEIRATFQIPLDVELEHHFIVDPCCARDVLDKRVKTLVFREDEPLLAVAPPPLGAG